ncbi:ATP-binding cassette domain-containing protein [Micromonospora chokoriensis]|uniref:ABC-type multidrug transport system, ATPase and permease component n=1 Tax=Micromonospora chokoriensis TaxID=356851 RepID=A0A1C4ZAF6_9ACTN|nr:ABC transporter ATP-binding protein [Micromonospora chokoriensis]SCF29982.1 ABC-type multidrug transport system, ATPase and permease component [Micromonospora chokoriensis]
MRLLRDLWGTSTRRMTIVVILIVLGAAGQAGASALAGAVLVHRSAGFFAVLAAALVAVVLSDLAVSLLMAGLTADWSADVRRRLCRVALGQDLPTLETTPVGELLDRIDGDVYQVASAIRNQGTRLAQGLCVGLLSMIVALVVWWPAGVAMLLLTVVLAVSLRRPTARIGPARMAEEEAWSDLAAVMEEAVHGQDDVRTSLARPYVLRLYARRAAAVLSRGRLVWVLSAKVASAATATIRAGIGVVVLGGAWALATGRVDAARLTAIWLLALAFGATAEHVSRMVPEIQEALGAWARVQLLQRARQEPVGGVSPTEGDLRIEDLTFTYQEGGRGAALRGLSLTFARGRSYALIGRTGSGKSTLAKVLTRAVDVPPGSVYLGDTDLGDLDVEQLRRWVALVPQRTEILAGTLAENVALFDPDLLDAAARALDELGLAGWIAELPDGLATRLGEGGHILSAGQEQLVAFARILVRDPHVVILDEATARLDPVTEARVQRATERLLRDRIGIVIAHRLSSVRRCDEVVVLADGAVVEAGPLETSTRFAELLATSHAAAYATAGTAGRAGGGTDLLVGPDPALDWPTDPASAWIEPDNPVGSATAWADPTGPASRWADPSGLAIQPDNPTASAEPDNPTASAEPDNPTVLGEPDNPTVLGEPDKTVRAERDKQIEPTTTRAELAGSTPAMSGMTRADPPPLPPVPPARTLREIFRLCLNDPRYGMAAIGLFLGLSLLGLDGPVLPWLWADLVDGTGSPYLPAVGIVAGLLVTMPLPYYTHVWFPGWWVRQMLRIGLRLVHGQTGPRRVSSHTPAEVVAQGGDTERVVQLADNVLDQAVALVLVVAMTAVTGSVVPGLFFLGTMVVSGLAATLFGPKLERAARATVAARAAFATALVSALSAARTVKLAGATTAVLRHLASLDVLRSDRQRREISVQVWARSTPSMASGLLPIGAWALYLGGGLSAGAVLVAVSTLGAARWFAWTTASLISQLPSARVWTRRTVAMTGVSTYSAGVPAVDLAAGTAPAPTPPPRHPLRRLELRDFGVVHSDGTVAVRNVDLTVQRGQLVLVVGPVGSGKSSLLRALAGIVHHTGELAWNGDPVTEPELFLRPNQVGYVGQLPRVLSGTVAENIALGHQVDAAGAVSTAQLDHDLVAAGGGLGLLIGHKGTRLSGGQLQRLALARALAPRTELLVADDVSSALDVTTELALWQALRDHGVTVVGSTAKRAALVRADHVVVLLGGAVAAQGTWQELEGDWSHLAG